MGSKPVSSLSNRLQSIADVFFYLQADLGLLQGAPVRVEIDWPVKFLDTNPKGMYSRSDTM